MAEFKSNAPPAENAGASQTKNSQMVSRRRSSRVSIDVPVEIFGHEANGKVFRAETRTITVNAHGARLILTLTMDLKPSILLINRKTSLEVQCRVIYQKENEKGNAEIGVEFITPQPRFWGIAFPPEDWNNADRKKPSGTSK